jgi:hypothetical protein
MNVNGSFESNNFKFILKRMAPLISKSFFKKVTKSLSKYKENFNILNHRNELSEDPLGKWILKIDFEEKSRDEKYQEYLEKQKVLINSIVGDKGSNAFENTNNFLTFFKK